MRGSARQSANPLVFFVVALLALFAVRAHAENGLPPILRDVGIDQRLGEKIPLDLTFRDERGQTVALRDLVRDRPVILNLVYYECPMLCTLVLNGLVSAMRALPFEVGREFDIITVSFDPRETPDLAVAKKTTYLEQYGRPGAAASWHFLTGDAAAIAELTKSVGFRAEYDEKEKQFAHAAAIMVLTPDGRLSRYFYGIEYPPRDLRLSLVEASENRIGSVVDQILLFCFHYDPATGRYGALTMNVVRIAGALTVLALLGTITIFLRRESAHRPPAHAG